MQNQTPQKNMPLKNSSRKQRFFFSWLVPIALLLTLGESALFGAPATLTANPTAKTATTETTETDSKTLLNNQPAVKKQVKKSKKQKWVRLLNNAQKKPQAFQTVIVRYIPADTKEGQTPSYYVDLVGAVHVGDVDYYQTLNKLFTSYDAVLYEMVAPKGTVIPQGTQPTNAHPIGAMQNGMKGMLGLSHQLTIVDYTKENFVHADMTPKEFASAMKKRNESFAQMAFRMIGSSIAAQSRGAAKGESADMEMVMAMFSSDRELNLKIALAKQLATMDKILAGFGGKQGSAIINERNKAALKVLKTTLQAKKKRIAIFYGAAHLSDMDKTLRKEFALKPIKTSWITAWDLTGK